MYKQIHPGRRRQRQYDDLGILRKELEKNARRGELYALTGGNALTIAYLQRRACDIARFGKETADLTFPQPSWQGVTEREVASFVDWMAEVLQTPARQREQEQDKRLATAGKEIQKYFDEIRRQARSNACQPAFEDTRRP